MGCAADNLIYTFVYINIKKKMDNAENSSLYGLFQESLTDDNLFMIGTSVDTGEIII